MIKLNLIAKNPYAFSAKTNTSESTDNGSQQKTNRLCFNKNRLACDTVSFGSNKKNQLENKRLGVDSQLYGSFTGQVKEQEKNRRLLQLEANRLGIKIELPTQEDFAEAICTELELRSGDNKVKQATFLYNKTLTNKLSKDEIRSAQKGIAIAEKESKKIKDSIPQDKKEKSAKIISQYEKAKEQVSNAVLDIKKQTLIDLLGQDIIDVIDEEKLKHSSINYAGGGFNDDYIEDLITKSLAAEELGKKPKDLTEKEYDAFDYKAWELEEIDSKITDKMLEYSLIASLRSLGVKKESPTEEDLFAAQETYRKELLNHNIITKAQYDYD